MFDINTLSNFKTSFVMLFSRLLKESYTSSTAETVLAYRLVKSSLMFDVVNFRYNVSDVVNASRFDTFVLSEVKSSLIFDVVNFRYNVSDVVNASRFDTFVLSEVKSSLIFDVVNFR
jgi:hypothetical protein